MPPCVVVVTADQGLAGKLEGDGDKDLELRFAYAAYEVSTLVGTFRPGFVLLDMESMSDASDILERLLQDRRVPGLRVILCKSPRPGLPLVGERLVGTLRKPFDRAAIMSIIQSIPMEHRSSEPVRDSRVA